MTQVPLEQDLVIFQAPEKSELTQYFFRFLLEKKQRFSSARRLGRPEPLEEPAGADSNQKQDSSRGSEHTSLLSGFCRLRRPFALETVSAQHLIVFTSPRLR
jgi:hypothetical protein